jgi:hypothetical protein
MARLAVKEEEQEQQEEEDEYTTTNQQHGPQTSSARGHVLRQELHGRADAGEHQRGAGCAGPARLGRYYATATTGSGSSAI